MADKKTILITGAGRGIGKMLASHYIATGAYNVAGISKSSKPFLEFDFFSNVCVDDPAQIATLFSDLKKKNLEPDIVINNASVLTSQYAMIMTSSQAEAMISTNLLGTFLVSKEAAKQMRRKRFGRIINISSMAASLEPAGDSVYAATKMAVQTLANVFARELGSLGITCNSLGVTAIETDMLNQLPRDKIDEIVSDLRIPRYAELRDIINVIDFFISPSSDYITAQTLYLGGIN